MTSAPFADDYPFLEVLWSMLVFVGFVFWIWLAVLVFMDIFRRRDMGGFAKALWIVVVIVFPLVGVLVYLIAYHNSIADRDQQRQEAAQASFQHEVRKAADRSGPASEIETAKRLLDANVISQTEYEELKTKALAGHA